MEKVKNSKNLKNPAEAEAAAQASRGAFS